MIRFFKNDQHSNPGNKIHIILSPVVDEFGNIDLVESGKEDTDAIINSYAKYCDINIILANAVAGDPSGLNRVQGSYGDFTRMPKTYAEFLQLQIDSNKMFEKLPPDIKKQFDNDPNKFMCDAGSDDWFKKIGIVKEDPKVETTESEVKKE